MDIELFSGVLVSLSFSIFFSGMEVAFLSANKLQIELLTKQGKAIGLIMTFFLQRPTWLAGITLVGNIASLLLFGACSTRLLMPFLMKLFPFAAGVVISTIVLTALLTILVLYTAEYVSKSVFVIHADRILAALIFPFVLFSILLFPLVYPVISLAKFFSVNLLKLTYSMERPVFGLTDVNQYLKSIQRQKPAGENIEVDTKIFTNALEFKSVRVRDCMIPRTEIIAVGIDGGIQKLHEAFIESGHSKIIVYKDSIDDVTGYCHSAALFKRPANIEDILTPILTVPEAMLAKDLMVRFINERKSLAIVVDEFGGTSGIVSMEDVIEEIFGEIEDEHDEDDLIEQKINEHTYLLSARLEIDYLNETYGWNLPTGDYDTLNGLILTYVADLPKKGDIIKISHYTFLIHSMEENRINTVRLTVTNIINN